MMLTLMLTSKGVAGVPRASLVILAGTLATFNLPVEGVAVILGVDTLMDMARTSVNLLGNCLATAGFGGRGGVGVQTAPPADPGTPKAENPPLLSCGGGAPLPPTPHPPPSG